MKLFVKIWLVLSLLLCCACAHEGSGSGEPGMWLVDFYRGPLNHLSAVRSGECPMYPSCSEYARQCIKTFGPVRGWIMASDRLMRCGRDEVRLAPKIFVGDGYKVYDPPKENDLWTDETKDDGFH